MMCTNLRIAVPMICMLRLPRSCNAAVHGRITGLQRSAVTTCFQSPRQCCKSDPRERDGYQTVGACGSLPSIAAIPLQVPSLEPWRVQQRQRLCHNGMPTTLRGRHG